MNTTSTVLPERILSITLGSWDPHGPEAQGFRISPQAIAALKHCDCTLTKERSRIDIGLYSDQSFGSDVPLSRREIYARARAAGLALSPAEVGPCLRQSYVDQPNGERILVAMDPLAHAREPLYVFAVGCDERGAYLDVDDENPLPSLSDKVRRLWAFVVS
ncbi:MAG: hypothetical protein AAB365_00200 [Patescibacteria group bacterium]